MIIIWGKNLCSECQEVYTKIKEKYPDVRKKDFDILPEEPAIKRASIMATYHYMEVFPVVEIDDRAYTPAEAFKILGIK